MTILKAKITIFGFNFDVFKISFWVKQKLLLKTNRHFGQVENADVSDIANVFSPTFINPTFRYSPAVKYEKLDVQTSVLSIFAYSQIRKLGFQKSEIYKHSSFRYLPVAKYEHQNEVQDTSSSI